MPLQVTLTAWTSEVWLPTVVPEDAQTCGSEVGQWFRSSSFSEA